MKAEGTLDMLEKFLLGTLVLGFLFAFGLMRAVETGRSHVVSSPFVGGPESVTVDLRR